MRLLLAVVFGLLVFCVVQWMLMDPATHYVRSLGPGGIIVIFITVFAGIKGFFSVITG